jgi:hypothetical protein
VEFFIKLGPVTYERKGGGGWTLPEALAQVHGVGHARILRADGTVAVDDAGSDCAVTLVEPDGRRRSVLRRNLLCADPECVGHVSRPLVLA